MLLNIIFYAIVSFAFISMVHYLYNYLKENLTSPLIKDLIDIPEREYKHIYKILDIEKEKPSNADRNAMKDELKQYFKHINKNATKKSSTSSTPPSFISNANDITSANIISNSSSLSYSMM
jgi:tRNA(Ile)-lysidine synthase TilS/MesJ